MKKQDQWFIKLFIVMGILAANSAIAEVNTVYFKSTSEIKLKIEPVSYVITTGQTFDWMSPSGLSTLQNDGTNKLDFSFAAGRKKSKDVAISLYDLTRRCRHEIFNHIAKHLI